VELSKVSRNPHARWVEIAKQHDWYFA